MPKDSLQSEILQAEQFLANLNAEMVRECNEKGGVSGHLTGRVILECFTLSYRKTPHDAWKATLLAGRLRLPAPLWAIELLKQTERYVVTGVDENGEKVSGIEYLLGFKGKGKGGQKKIPVQESRQRQVRDALCGCVRALMASGVTLTAACKMTVRKFRNTPYEPAWKNSVYKVRIPGPDSLRKTYGAWEKEMGEDLLSAFDKHLASISLEAKQKLFNNFRLDV